VAIARLAVLLLLAPPVFADDSGHPVTLWEVHGASNSVYLLGSIHLLRKQDYPLPAVLDAAYQDAEVLVMEVDMDDFDPLAAGSAFNRYGVLHDDRTLADLMGTELYAEAERAAAAVDIPLDMLQKTEPWYAAMTIEVMMLSRIGFDPSLGVEMQLAARAKNDGKPINGLETVEQQVRMLDSLSLPAQRELLLSTLQESARIAGMMDKIIAAWRHGDVDFLAGILLDELAMHDELNKAIVTDRNQRWVRQISDLTNGEDDYLVIVGALHLVGESGVPRQLQRLGFDVRQLSESAAVR